MQSPWPSGNMGPKEPTVDTARAQCMVHPIASLTLVLNQIGMEAAWPVHKGTTAAGIA